MTFNLCYIYMGRTRHHKRKSRQRRDLGGNNDGALESGSKVKRVYSGDGFGGPNPYCPHPDKCRASARADTCMTCGRYACPECSFINHDKESAFHGQREHTECHRRYLDFIRDEELRQQARSPPRPPAEDGFPPHPPFPSSKAPKSPISRGLGEGIDRRRSRRRRSHTRKTRGRRSHRRRSHRRPPHKRKPHKRKPHKRKSQRHKSY